MSSYYVAVNDVAEVRDTILHEIAHAHVGNAAGHGPVWQRMARSIGCNGERTTAAKIAPPGRYEIQCPTGHVLGSFHRRVSRSYSCKAHRVPVRIFDTHTGRFLDGDAPVSKPAPAITARPANPWDGGTDWDAMFNA
jgi:predicted SprT family Zn-dependent metalloprotease